MNRKPPSNSGLLFRQKRSWTLPRHLSKKQFKVYNVRQASWEYFSNLLVGKGNSSKISLSPLLTMLLLVFIGCSLLINSVGVGGGGGGGIVVVTLRPHCFVYLKRKRINPSLTSVLGLLAMIKVMSLSRKSFHSLIFSTGIYFTMNLSYPAQQKKAFFRSGFPNWIRIKRLNKHTKTNKNKPFTILLLTAR